MITIYSMTMLIWGSRYRWTLASTLLYVGFAGWAIGGVGAVIDSIIPINFRLHNTTWVVAHFHTYLMLTRRRLGARVPRPPARARRRPTTSSRAARTWTVGLILVGGYGLTGTWFVEGVLGDSAPLRDPAARHQRLQPRRQHVRARARARLSRLLPAAHPARPRTAWARRHYVLVDHVDSWTGTQLPAPRRRRSSGRRRAADLAAGGVPLCESSASSASASRPASSRSLAFFPQIVDASETSNRYHHLDHAGQFFFGAMLGLVLGSLPAISRRLGDHSSIGLAAVLVAPMLMMLVMVPRIYEPLEPHPFEHALYHLAMAAFGLVTGLGATRLGLVTGRFMFILSVGMPLMFAAAMK